MADRYRPLLQGLLSPERGLIRSAPLHTLRQPPDPITLAGPEPWRAPGGGVVPHVICLERRRYRDVTARVTQSPFQEHLRPRGDTEGRERRKLRSKRRLPDQGSLTVRTHEDDAEIEVGGKRKDPLLDVAFERVVGDLDRADAAGIHQGGEIGKGRGTVVRGADRHDFAFVLQPLEHVEMFAPVDEVMKLVEVDPAAEEPQGTGRLAPSFFC